jgi:chemotaxis protein MotB
METQPIIIKRKKAVHGHHGGAWKVAYADFVTAMMALFIVLWLLSSSEKVKQAVGGYFMDPSGAGKQIGTGLAGTGESLSIAEKDMRDLKEKLEDAIRSIPQLKNMQDQIKITITGEGLRIELLESETGTFFESGRGKPNANCVTLLSTLAGELGKLKNTIIIEGHTDAKPFIDSTTYTNWDLSTDRANAARAIMQATGLRPDQVAQVRGFADQELRRKDDPFNASNRRISVIVQYKNMPQQIAEASHTK